LLDHVQVHACKVNGPVPAIFVQVHDAEADSLKRTARSSMASEYRLQVAGRGVDHLQHLGRCRLPFQRLALLGKQPSVLDSDDACAAKFCSQRDLFVGKTAALPAGKLSRSRARRRP